MPHYTSWSKRIHQLQYSGFIEDNPFPNTTTGCYALKKWKMFFTWKTRLKSSIYHARFYRKIVKSKLMICCLLAQSVFTIFFWKIRENTTYDLLDNLHKVFSRIFSKWFFLETLSWKNSWNHNSRLLTIFTRCFHEITTGLTSSFFKQNSMLKLNDERSL